MDADETLRQIVRQEMTNVVKAKLKSQFSVFFEQWSRYLDDRFNEFEQRVEDRLDSMESKIDFAIDRLDTDEIERAAMYVQMSRHDDWIHEVTKKSKIKLSAT